MTQATRKVYSLPFPGNPDASFHTRFGNFRDFSEQLENDVMPHDAGWSHRVICRFYMSSDRLRVSPQVEAVVSHPGESWGPELCCSTTVVVTATTARIPPRSSAPLWWVLIIDRVVASIVPLSSDTGKAFLVGKPRGKIPFRVVACINYIGLA